MTMLFIILLIVFGLLFMTAEIVFLPGVSIGAILSLVCYGSSIYLAFRDHGIVAGCIVIAAIILLSILATVFSLRAKTWQRFSLKQKIDAKPVEFPEEKLQKGDRGMTLSRLSPMGKVEIRGGIYEAKSQDAYIDPKSEIEVIGFENFNVIVRKTNN